MSVWIGIDLGTQSVRAMAVDGSGQVLGAASRALTSHRDGPRHEQDPEQWWEELAAATREALAGVPASRIAGVAVDATSGTVLLTDGHGDPLTPALMYDDRRATEEVERVNVVGARVWERLGYQRMQPNWALPKLLWLLRAEGRPAPQHTASRAGGQGGGDRAGAQAVRRGGGRAEVRLAHQSDFVNRRLVGTEVATDLSNALKTGVDLIDERWPYDVLDALGVPAEVLPDVVRPGSVLGVVCAAAAEATGLPEGTPVIAGTTDGCAAQLGAGALRPGSWNSVLGTTLVLKGVTEELIHDPLGVVYSHRAPDGSWLPGGASSTGAGVLARDLPGRDLAALSRQATARYGTGGGGTDFLPITYPLVSRGERFPFAAPEAEGFTLGEAADDVERYVAILRGAAFVERLCFDYLDLLGAPVDGEIILTGGATRSAYWNQLRADVLGRPVTLRENAEPALGMALLAASATTGPAITDPATAGTGPAAAATAASGGGMVRTRAVIDPSGAEFHEPYLRFIAELEDRGWLPTAAADHARERTAR
ncbi:carbohydrate kinase [Nonomuraea glycinis]|uniref:Carbohydrate kinase n=1 Tax=Nonomuraea glycinis TaxID=2047744 RepID=A0A918A1Q6_9ACTN|nr:FGGY family carbohydrate kinase [Nonomuraea glycinis]MCA2175036.1 carbohydrate kinase [Nonomuraea glycinis]GGP01035.1 carbohydrate kinase [Nonomuraea glycinis]